MLFSSFLHFRLLFVHILRVLVSCSAYSSVLVEVKACFLISRLWLILPSVSLGIEGLLVGRSGLWVYNHLKEDLLLFHRDLLSIQVTPL